MKFFVENEKSLSWISRFDRLSNYDACNKKCQENKMHPFKLQDFYNYADKLNQTYFFFLNNLTDTHDVETNSSVPIEMKKHLPNLKWFPN